ncbi:MAG: FecR domain-containing protein [Pseudomonas sp.]
MSTMSRRSSRVTSPMAGGQPISETVADQAAEWLTLLMSGENNEEQHRRWRQWRGAHPDHERAWQHVEAVTQRMKVLESGVGYRVLSPYASPASRSRRKLLNAFLWGGVAIGGGGLLVSRTPAVQRTLATHRTGAGEQRSFILHDGSNVTLDTASAIDVRFDGEYRLLRLVEGEVFVVTAHALGGPEDRRPFLVKTAEGCIRALGTRFSVRQWNGRTSVSVLESAVEITPSAGGLPRIVRAGEHASFTRQAIAPPRALAESDNAWMRGQIVAENMRLSDFLQELERYRPGLVRYDPAVADLHLSGVFPLRDTDRILATLPNVLPVQVRLRTRWWVSVELAE